MITGKLILRGTLKLESPALIGCGQKERTDIDLLRDADGMPFIPSSSLTGVLRHVLYNEKDENNRRFWGFTDSENCSQSLLRCSDAHCIDREPSVVIRDGIAINSKNGMVKDNAKYDYEVMERGTAFSCCLEITVPEGMTDFCRSMAATMVDLLSNGAVSVGAKTNSGLGKTRLMTPEYYEFDFTRKADVLRWLKRDYGEPGSLKGIDRQRLDDNSFSITATCAMKSSMIVRTYPSGPDMPDAVHIQSGGDNVLPGTSLKGAVRSRAERILRTLGLPDMLLTNLFGDVDAERNIKKKGRVVVEEAVLPNYLSEIHTRIKIDRFTGGTIEGALFETMPLFSDGTDGNKFNIRISIKDYAPHEAGLLLLVLKDLWNGDLPVGGEKGAGRGVLRGIGAEIMYGGRTISFKTDPGEMPPEALAECERMVNSLVTYSMDGGVQ